METPVPQQTGGEIKKQVVRMCLSLCPLPASFQSRRQGAGTTAAVRAGDLVLKEGAIVYTCLFREKQCRTGPTNAMLMWPPEALLLRCW